MIKDTQLSTAAYLRRATSGDWAQVEGLLESNRLPLAGAADHFQDFFVANVAGEVIGCVGLERYGSSGLLRSLAVSSAHRGAGIGQALVNRCVEFAATSGIQTLVLLTETAEPFFDRLGFQRVDRQHLPESVSASREFQDACPASAVAMRYRLETPKFFAQFIRPASEFDLDVIASIYNEGIRDRSSTFETRERDAAELRPWLEQSQYPLLIAEVGGHVIAWARAGQYRPRECYASIGDFSIYVQRSARGVGIGRILLRELIRESANAGLHKLVGRVFPENAASRALCRTAGFREVGRYERHGQIDGEWRDVIVVERLLGQ